MMPKKHSSSINYGIQADTVTVDVGAFGPGAHAKKLVTTASTGDAALVAAIAEFRKAIDRPPVPSALRTAAERHLNAIQREAKKPNPSKRKLSTSLKGIKSTLDTVAGIASDVTSLLKPLKRIAKLVGIGLATVGLS